MKAVGWSAPIIHCVAPTVWAWGRWRAKKFVKSLDGLLCLFPFEPEYFRDSNLETHFIGHPEAFKNYQPKKFVNCKKSESRQIVLLPGSRQSEIKLILPQMLVASSILRRHDPRFSFILPALPSFGTRQSLSLTRRRNIRQPAFAWLNADPAPTDRLFGSKYRPGE